MARHQISTFQPPLEMTTSSMTLGNHCSLPHWLKSQSTRGSSARRSSLPKHGELSLILRTHEKVQAWCHAHKSQHWGMATQDPWSSWAIVSEPVSTKQRTISKVDLWLQHMCTYVCTHTHIHIPI